MNKVLIGLALVLCLLAGCQTGKLSLSAGGNWQTATVEAIYSPDPNGGVGVRVMADSLVAEGIEDNIAVGPALNFNLGDVAWAITDRIVPGNWQPPTDVPVQLYGTLSLLWQTQDGDILFLPGSEVRLFPKLPVTPYVRTEYLQPEGSSALEPQVVTTVGAVITF